MPTNFHLYFLNLKTKFESDISVKFYPIFFAINHHFKNQISKLVINAINFKTCYTHQFPSLLSEFEVENSFLYFCFLISTKTRGTNLLFIFLGVGRFWEFFWGTDFRSSFFGEFFWGTDFGLVFLGSFFGVRFFPGRFFRIGFLGHIFWVTFLRGGFSQPLLSRLPALHKHIELTSLLALVIGHGSILWETQIAGE